VAAETGAAPVFQQVGTTSLYALSSAGQAGVAGYWAGYRPGVAFGATATLDQAWQDPGGVYLFLNRTPQDLAAFLARFDTLRPNLPATLRVLWLANPDDSPGAWQLQFLGARSSGSGAGITWRVAREARFTLGGYAVDVRAGVALTQASPGVLGYGIGVDTVGFLAPGGGYPADSGSAWLPLAGSAVGALAAVLTLSNGDKTPDDLAMLGVGLRYAYPAVDGSGAVDAVPMPLLRQRGAALSLHLTFDPMNPLLPDRTNLGFFPVGGTGAPPALGATLVTTRGHGTTLKPLAAAAPLRNARLVFCFSPLLVTSTPGDGYVDYYLAPDGAFDLVTTTPAELLGTAVLADRLTFGLSGLEYAGLPVGTGTVAFFQAGQPAFVPGGGDGGPLDGRATTSYVALVPPTSGAAGRTYFAQPRQAPLYTGGDLGPGFLSYHEMPAATLPSWTTGGPVPAAVPIGAYSGIDPGLAGAARAVEQAGLAPARRLAIGLPPDTGVSTSTVDYAVTPQGLVAALSAGGDSWAGLVLGNLPGAKRPQLAFTEVGPRFQAALQANELFFVVSDVDTFMAAASVAYRLDPATLALLGPAGVPTDVVTALNTVLKGMSPAYPEFETEAAFDAAIGSVAGAYLSRIQAVAGLLKADLDGWTFQLSPRSWRPVGETGTVMLVKFAGRSLEELVDDASAWGWPAAAQDGQGSVVPTQRMIQRVIAEGRAAAAGTPYARFYHDVVRDPSWNGVLFLNAPVAIAELPADLQFLAAGIDPGRFYAHHVGFSLTPVDVSTGTIVLGRTAVFGLIDYQDPEDLYLSATVPFAFKTLALSARFANAALADFSVRAELMVNRLFGAELAKRNPERGNNLVLDGNYQRLNDAPVYSFVLQGENVYDTTRSALDSIEVLGVQSQTATGTAAAGTVTARFVLGGNLRFAELDRFDLFSYGRAQRTPVGETPADGYLRFGRLVVTMTFPLENPARQTFTVDESALGFDPANSQVRPRSLAAGFPLSFTNLLSSPNLAAPGEPARGQTPEDLGYTSISAPIDQTPLVAPWYGLVFTLDLGTLGALAGSAGLSLRLLAAWAPGLGPDDEPVYLGLQLPSARSLGIDWPLEGVLRLGFRSFQFEVSDLDDGGRAYLLRLRRLALSVLGWSFPPGNRDVFLFGDPGADGSAALGWYAAHDSGDDKPAAPPRRLRSGRRALPPTSGL